MPPFENRLAQATSPYLQQHKLNPVDWYPWGEEALEQARAQDKPILLSIGYSACHWCHVMAHESFEDEDTAALMNDYFINLNGTLEHLCSPVRVVPVNARTARPTAVAGLSNLFMVS